MSSDEGGDGYDGPIETEDTFSPLKRKRSDSPDIPDYVHRPALVDDPDDIYGRAHFGNFGEYMRRKRAKLQIQNSQLVGTPLSSIFHGVSIYINGITDPPAYLRRMILENGGVYMPYLHRKTEVTHVIATNLTPAKVKEYQNLKVVLPQWIVQCVTEGKLLPWQRFMYRHPIQQGPSLLTHNFSSTKFGPPSQNSDASTSTVKRHREVDVLYTTDPATKKDAERVPGYSAHSSNVAAQRAMSRDGWRETHTAASADFVEGYYKNSRLHHLSTWKTELKELVKEAQNRAAFLSLSQQEPKPRTTPSNVSMRGADLPEVSKRLPSSSHNRVIMHCDFDSFFVSVGLTSHPNLRGRPVVVCHSSGSGNISSTSEIASCSYEARESGVRNGMSLHQARTLCPDIATLPYEFERYKEISLAFYTILMTHADDLQAVSVDEALIEVTNAVAGENSQPSSDPAKDFAEKLRANIFQATSCTVSIGIGPNILLARLASRQAKPNGSCHLQPTSLPALLPSLDIKDLHGIGSSTKSKVFEKLGTSNLGDLLGKSRGLLRDALGTKTGDYVYNALRGIDDRKLESDKARQSVSTEVNYGIRFVNLDEAKAFIHNLSIELARRLEEAHLAAHHIAIKIMKRHPDAPEEAPKFMGHGLCDTFHKSGTITGGKETSDPQLISENAFRLLKSFGFEPRELRGIGISVRPPEPLEKGQSPS
ncbi:hypothetical protein DL96DRAFT_1456120 [Flagelloscypha sp. PMI_526]|nr:hypothetical protein DL96DRAFT_1456120 [Flagelloscypha sp. PMI_526]